MHEEPKEGLNVDKIQDSDVHGGTLATLGEDAKRLYVHRDELNQLLHGREVLFPPDGLRMGRDEVVRVHDRVNESV
jgi:hypothetical protein